MTDPAHHPRGRSRRGSRVHRFLRRWFLCNALVAGALGLAWLVLRSGGKPSRIAYPCQQAALSAATLAFGAPLVAAVLALRRRIVEGVLTPRGLVVAATGLLGTWALWGYLSQAEPYRGPLLSAPDEYRAQVFHKTGCAQDPVGDRFTGLDDLIEIMGANGLKFHRSDAESLTAGPAGIVGADDVVAIKINYQWSERGGTNTDLLRGLIRRIVDHPDGFTGEVVVCENAQFRSTQGFDRAENNAQDVTLSPHDVVVGFQAQGYRVSHFDWTPVRFEQVEEYSAGDARDGYIVYDFDAALLGSMSYPKFTTDYGTLVSLRHGIWDPVGETYDRDRFTVINVPVLKSHSATYGVTASVKNYMGLVTRELSTNSHYSIRLGLLGAVMDEIEPPELNILDAIWVNADPNKGPATYYEDGTRLDELVAGVDPIALDLWAAKHILIPAFLGNGHSPPWPDPSADPDDPTSDFRRYLDASMNYLLAGGHEVTNDPAKIDALDVGPPGEASDPEGTGAPLTIGKDPGGFALAWSDPVRGGPFHEFHLYRTDLSGPGHATHPECELYLGTGNTAIVPALPGGHGFLVVARGGVGDGSFGKDSRGFERPNGGAANVCP